VCLDLVLPRFLLCGLWPCRGEHAIVSAGEVREREGEREGWQRRRRNEDVILKETRRRS